MSILRSPGKMVAGAIAAVAIVAGIIFFSKDIGAFLREFKPLAPFDKAGEAINQAGKDAGTSFGTTVLRPVNIVLEENRLEQEARQQGFTNTRGLTAREERALATDSGSVVIGSKNNTVQFGLIGDIIPSNPSPEFIKNADKLLTPDQLRRFNFQQNTPPKGGQTAIGTNTIKVNGKTQIDPIAKTGKLFTNFGESFQKTLTGGKLFSELF